MLHPLPQDFIDLVRNKTGLNKTNVESIWSVYDTLFCEVRRPERITKWLYVKIRASGRAWLRSCDSSDHVSDRRFHFLLFF